jgi:hypothetical protein
MRNEWVDEKQSEIEGFGLFAKKKIPKGTKIIQYVGKYVTKDQAEEVEDQRYLFELNDIFDIDGKVDWNPARLVNHSCDPNCEVENIDDEIWIVALKDIKTGGELSYNYGYGLDDYEDWPCNCRSKNCVGFMVDEDLWDKLPKKEKN